LQPFTLSTPDQAKFAAIGAGLYCGNIRKSAARQQVFSIFKKQLPALQAPTALHIASAPFVLTPRATQTWRLISTAISSSESQEPILVVGPNGCGKTSVIQALASMLQQAVEGCFLTPESEPSDLVGQQLPTDVSGPGLARIQWTDGVVTKAYKHGSWLLLDNLAQAEACVLERLNPLLEQPPVWLLTENAEVEPVKAKVLQDGVLGTGPASGYQLFATTTPSKQQKSNMSPALANRFTNNAVHQQCGGRICCRDAVCRLSCSWGCNISRQCTSCQHVLAAAHSLCWCDRVASQLPVFCEAAQQCICAESTTFRAVSPICVVVSLHHHLQQLCASRQDSNHS